MALRLRIQPMKGNNNAIEMAIVSRELLPEVDDRFRFVDDRGILTEGTVNSRIFDHSVPNSPVVILLIDVTSA